MTNKPIPQICTRLVDEAYYAAACAAGYDPLVAKIVASRPILSQLPIEAILSPKLKFLDHPQTLPDIDRACERILRAIENNEIIGIETDHDCDGQTSHAVIVCALIECLGVSSSKIKSYIGHRLKEGYGLSEKVVERILADDPLPSLIITADNGSSDEARIAILKAKGIDVIVTDHHEIPSEGIPSSAYAVVNPIREDSLYPDRGIAGCMVAWLLMAALRQKAMEKWGKSLPNLANLLDFVAVGTIADCVSMAKSQNNRAVVSFGMKLIERGERPCWRVLKPLFSIPLSSEDLGFKIGPLLNSDGRLACAFGSVSFLLAQTDEEAARWVAHLQEQNQSRKTIQDEMLQIATVQAKQRYQQGYRSLCIFLEEGHPGVHGICASRIKDAFGRPVIIFSPKMGEANILTGSGRSIEGLHLRQVLQTMADREPIIERFGGHKGAAGVSILRENLSRFIELFESVVSEIVQPSLLGPKVWVDGDLPLSALNYDNIKKLFNQLEPFGREFEPPLFEVMGKVIAMQSVGEKGVHLRLRLALQGGEMEAIWFNAREGGEFPWPVAVGETVQAIYAPKLQTFRGETKVACQIVYAAVPAYNHQQMSCEV